MHKRSKFECNWLLMLVTVTLNMVYVLIVAPPVTRVKRVASYGSTQPAEGLLKEWLRCWPTHIVGGCIRIPRLNFTMY